jgi:hypothetical protein
MREKYFSKFRRLLIFFQLRGSPNFLLSHMNRQKFPSYKKSR